MNSTVLPYQTKPIRLAANAPALNRGLLYWLTGLVGLGLIVPGFDFIVYGMLALHAIRGPRQAIEAFSIMFVFLLGNPSFTTAGAKNLRYLVIFTGFLRLLIDALSSRRDVYSGSKPFVILLIFFLFMLPVSALASKNGLISALKLVSFFMVSASILYHFERSKVSNSYWINWFHTLFLFILIASALFVALGMGYERNGRGFQGLFSHPQVFGPVMSVVSAWFTWQWIAKRQKTIVDVTLMGLSWVFIYISLARTGMLAAGGGALLAFFLFLVNGKKLPYLKSLMTFGTVLLLGLTFLFLLQPERFTGIFIEFVQKRAEGETEASAIFQESRGRLVEESLANFREYPLLGIGLGIPSDFESLRVGKSDTFMGIPLSASVEKGFLPSAVLEELGLIGALFTILLILALLKPALQSGQFVFLWMGISALLINVGEAVFYSVGGTGLFVWMMLGLCYTLGKE